MKWTIDNRYDYNRGTGKAIAAWDNYKEYTLDELYVEYKRQNPSSQPPSPSQDEVSCICTTHLEASNCDRNCGHGNVNESSPSSPGMRDALEKALPYLKEMNEDNIHDPSVGLYGDMKLSEAIESVEQALTQSPAEPHSDYVEALKKLLRVADCPETLIENPFIFGTPTQEDREWAEGVIAKHKAEQSPAEAEREAVEFAEWAHNEGWAYWPTFPGSYLQPKGAVWFNEQIIQSADKPQALPTSSELYTLYQQSKNK
jgi:hypothetical protein